MLSSMTTPTPMETVRHARLRCAYEHESATARGFWRLHPSPFLTSRSLPMLRRAASRGRLLVVEESGHWAACAAAFDFGDLGIVELSDTRVVEGLQGFRIQRRLLTPARIAAAVAAGPATEIVMIIDRANKRSLENAEQAGFEPYAHADEDTRAMLGLRVSDEQYELLRLPRHRALSEASELSRATQSDGALELRHAARSGEVLRVQVDMDIVHLSTGSER